MDVKIGTQTWSAAKQQSSLKADNTHSMSASDKQNVLGDKDLGEYLNKVADPNWVDPNKMRGVGNDELDKDAFLKLFLAQLKNQDPTNTMDSHELAAQLAQFSQLEKLSSINEGIGALGKNKGSDGQFEVLSLVGKTISGDSSKIIRADEKDAHDITFDIKSDAELAEFSIRNVNGQEIRKLEARGLRSGANKVTWDGKLENGNPAETGEYNVIITAKGAGGQKLGAETRFEGQVSGIQFTAQGPVLKVGQQTVKLSDVKGIIDPALSQSAQARAATSTKSPASVRSLKAENGAAPRVAGMGGNLDSVGMQQGLINKIEKEVIKNNNPQDGQNKEI